jgi:DNA-binding IclR family transcriptional regulator
MRVGMLSMALPVHYNGQVVASVGLVFEVIRYREVQRLMPLLRGTVERIEASMAGSPTRIVG